MEFWGVEVKPGQTVKCEPGDERYLHLSQVSLGEFKKDKGTETVPVFVKFNDQKLVLGTLSAENCAQIPFDIVFEKEFELSHGSKNTSVFFLGYKSSHESYDSEDDLSGSDVEAEAYLNDSKEIGEDLLKKNRPLKSGRVAASGKDDAVSAKAKPQTGKPDKSEKPKLDGIQNKVENGEEEDDDEGDSDEESDDDEEPTNGLTDSDSDDDEDEDEDDRSEDEEANLKAENGKKRSADDTLKSPIGKKAKVMTPAGNLKTGGDPKKDGQTTTPQSTKQAGKSSVSGDKAKQQNPKSSGSVMCKTCSKSFNSDNALQSHSKAKHSGAK